MEKSLFILWFCLSDIVSDLGEHILLLIGFVLQHHPLIISSFLQGLVHLFHLLVKFS